MKNLFTFKNFLVLGVLSNLMFILFIIVCLIYYDLFGNTGEISIPFEITAYSIEAIGFMLMTISIFGIILRVRQRMIMKILMSIYLIVEVIIMLVDFEFMEIGDWYDGHSKVFIISHSIFSAIVCFSYLSLEHKKMPLQIVVAIASCVMLSGMFAVIYNSRIYISVLTNAFAYVFLYLTMLIQLKLEIIEVDCYGDKARVQEYKSTFLD